MNKDVKFINQGEALNFNIGGFAIDPQNNNAFFAADHINVVLAVVGTGNVVVYGSTQRTPPDFSAASTIDNSYVPIVLSDYAVPNTYYPGATGVTVAVETKVVELNTNLLTWVAISRSVNTVDVKMTETNAQ